MKQRISITSTILNLLLGLWIPASTVGGPLLALQEETALNHLKEHGLYGSLQEAVTASRYDLNRESKQNGDWLPDNLAQLLRAPFTPAGSQVESGGAEGRSHCLGTKLWSAGYGARHVAARAASGTCAEIRHELHHSEISTDQSRVTELRINSDLARGNKFDGPISQPQVVLVHPQARGGWMAPTIQEGIEMVAPGGRVFVLPGTYPERLTVQKGVTVQGIGGHASPVIVAPPDIPPSVIEVATSEPVVLRGLTVHVPGAASTTSSAMPTPDSASRRTRRSRSMRPATTGGRNPDRPVWAPGPEMRSSSSQAGPRRCSCRSRRSRLPGGR